MHTGANFQFVKSYDTDNLVLDPIMGYPTCFLESERSTGWF